MLPPPMAIDWRGPDECQEAPRLSSEVARLVGGGHGDSNLVARVNVGRSGRRWHLVLTMDRAGRTTVRELDAESCAAATDAAAVILALTIDPSRALGDDAADAGVPPAPVADASASPPPAAPATPPVVEPIPPKEPAAAAARQENLPFVVMATAASDTGTLPHTGFGFGGGLGFAAKPLRLEATLAYWPTVSADVAGTPPRGGSFTMVVTELRGCALAEASFLSFGPCAGLGFTSMQAEAFGVTTPISAGATWSSFVADALALGRISRLFSLRLSVGLAVPFSRPTFEIQGLGVVHQPAAVALELGAGVEAHF
jgi:hypothetical protein